MFSRHRSAFSLFLILAAFSGACSSARAEVTILPDVESGKTVVSVDWVKPDKLVRLTLWDNAPPYWFLFGLRGVKDKTLTIDVVGQTSANGHFYWADTQPVVADTLDLSDPLLYDEQAYRKRHGSLPWRHVLGANYDSKTHTLSMTVHFESDEATVALTYPCPVSYVEKRLKQLGGQESKSQVGIYSAGTTEYDVSRSDSSGKEYRHTFEFPMQVITVPARTTQNAFRWKTKPTALLYAGEYATEHESSQVIMGALAWLLSGDPAAQKFTASHNAILIPHLFPAETVLSNSDDFRHIANGFNPGDSDQARDIGSIYNVSWAKFFNHYIDDGNRLDVIMDFGSPAPNPNLVCPMLQYADLHDDCSLVKSWNKTIMAQYKKAGLDVYPKLGEEGDYGTNLAGWLDDSFGATATFFSVSSQDTTSRLSLTQLRSMGVDALKGAGAVFGDPKLMALQRHRERKRLSKRRSLIVKALSDKNSGYDPKDPSDDWVYNAWF